MVKPAEPRGGSVDEERANVMGRFSRAGLLKGSLAVMGAIGGTAVGAAELAAAGDSRGSAATDGQILTFGLLIERLQAAFYAAALRGGSLSRAARQSAQELRRDVRAHFGLGAAARVDGIDVVWPDGLAETFPGGDADRLVVLSRGTGVRGGR